MLTESEISVYSSMLFESTSDTAVMAFGRFNPVSMGHVKLMQVVKQLAKKHNGLPMIFLSHSFDSKKNPLDYESKYQFVKRAAPAGVQVVHSAARTFFEVLKDLRELGIKHVYLVAGSDRLKDFERFKNYIDEYDIESLEILSAGKRDPDAEGVTGISGSKLRKMAVDSEKEKFIKNCGVTGQAAETMYDAVRIGLGVK